IGIVSVGYSVAQGEATVQHYNFILYGVPGAALLASILPAVVTPRRSNRAISGPDPQASAGLFQERDATLQSVREGIIAINRDGIITTVNLAALTTLGLDEDPPVAGRPILEILPESDLMSVLSSGIPDFDREVWLRNKQMVVNRL